jgi:predicted nucleic-acid-binding protein
MKAVDANVLLRWLTRDDPVQTPLADKVMLGRVFVPLTVLIEVVWVLRRSYRLDREALNTTMRVLVNLETVTIASDAGVRWALDRHEQGADLPDMIHLIACKGASAFVTFEDKIAKRAGASSPLPVEHLR